MALLIPAVGEPREVYPADGRAFSVLEMRTYLGGYLELVGRFVDDGCQWLAWCDEEGKLKARPVNRIASIMLAPLLHGEDVLVGDVLLTTLAEAGEDDAVEREEGADAE